LTASDLLDLAIGTQGGARYVAAKGMRVRIKSSGLAFVWKGKHGIADDFVADLSTSHPRAELRPAGRPGWVGIFDAGRVRIETENGELVQERNDPRSAILSFRHRLRWDRLDLCYFAGYALWTYMNTPFIFSREEFKVTEVEPWHEGGESWRGLEVIFPDSIPAHCKVQRFYFDERGVLRRNDYTAEVFGSWAKAAHYLWDHRDMDGLLVPARRRAMPRGRKGKPVRSIGLVKLQIDSVELR
jgi:hypothetical protein